MAPIDVPPLKIYHNPKCSKSRAALALLQERGLTPRIVEYLQAPPAAAELQAIIAMLGIRPEQLIRKGEEIYKARYAGESLSDDQWIAAMVADPILIERPIVVWGHRAVIGRPPETVLALLRK
ncbi:MAG: arsenate reductase (glutaredoxin) [Pseudomonadota bacterium]|nr:arsenate reductase (glutaredoxin) [Pseudomonadota bacterium]